MVKGYCNYCTIPIGEEWGGWGLWNHLNYCYDKVICDKCATYKEDLVLFIESLKILDVYFDENDNCVKDVDGENFGNIYTSPAHEILQRVSEVHPSLERL